LPWAAGTPKKYQCDRADPNMRDKGVRTVLYEVADVILTTPVKGGA